MKTQHTPGPWSVSERGSIEFEDGFVGEAYEYDPKNDDELPMMANARLMAAAPDLLYALRELYMAGLTFDRIPYYKALRIAKELIEKIEGDE